MTFPAAHVGDPQAQLNFEYLAKYLPRMHGPFVGGGSPLAPNAEETLTFTHNLGLRGTQVVVGYLFDGSNSAGFGWRASTGTNALTIVTRNLSGVNGAGAGWRGVIMEFE